MAELKDKDIQLNSDNKNQDNPESSIQAIKTTEFMKETIKQRPLNKRKLMRKLVLTIAMALIFGFVACMTFILLEPVINKRLNPNTEPEIELEDISFVEETVEEETLPEDMIVDESELQAMEQVPLGEEQIEQVLNNMELGLEDYLALSSVVTDMADEVSKSVVSVISLTQDEDWFNNEYTSEDIVSGVIVADNRRDLLILADVKQLTNTENLQVSFFDGSQLNASLMEVDTSTGLGIVVVNKNAMKNSTIENAIPIQMGVSANTVLEGSTIVALGRPQGIENSIGIGYITSSSSVITLPDSNYKLLTSSIYGSPEASGILVNIKGQLIGIIDMSKTLKGMNNTISAIGISELKRLIEKMSNGIDIPYLGMYGTDVTDDISQSLDIPKGVYITKLEMNSPLLDAGIQSGDIITKYGTSLISNYKDLNMHRLNSMPGEEVVIGIKRQGLDGYADIEYTIIIGNQ